MARLARVLLVVLLMLLLLLVLLLAYQTQAGVHIVGSQPESLDPSQTVYVTRTGSKYHWSDCHYLRQSKIPISLEQARKHYSPCRGCKPP